MSTPNTGIPYVPENTLDPAAGLNLALNVIDALLQTRVLSMALTAPPGSPADGDLYIPAAPATGDWLGLEDHLVRYVQEGDFWQSYVPGVQVHLVLNIADGGFYKYIPGSPGGWTLAAGLSDAPNNGLRYVRRNGTWEALIALLTVQDGESPPNQLADIHTLEFGFPFEISQPDSGVVSVGADVADPTASYITETDEQAVLPNSRRLVAVSGIEIDFTTPGQARFTGTGGRPLPNKEWRVLDAATNTFGATAAVALGTFTSPAKVTGAGIGGYIVKRRGTSTTAANNVTSSRSANVQDEAYASVTGSSRAAGFYLRIVFGTAIVVAGERFFCGMALNAAEAGTVDPSALLNCFGVAKDGADINYQIIHNDGAGSATKIDTGLAFAGNKFFELELSVPRGGGSWDYILTDMDTGTQYTGNVSSDIPAADVGLYWRLWASVGAVAGTAVAIDTHYIGLRYPL